MPNVDGGILNAVQPRHHADAPSQRHDRRSPPQRWTEAVETLQEYYAIM